MYATWLSYNVVTNMGIKSGVIVYDLPKWEDGTVSYRYTRMASPSKDNAVYGTAYVRTNGVAVDANSWPFGARPALHQEGNFE